MKKFYCFALVVLSLFSCVLFSACGDKYKDLRISFYSSAGEEIEEISFVIDEGRTQISKTVEVELSGIDKKDVGQIKVYSVPNELVVDSDYIYNGNSCSVTLTAIRPSSENAKLVVSHLASGKKKEIDLNIEQKSSNLTITNNKYIISIPDEGDNIHIVNFSNLLNLIPVGSTDDIYFKIKGACPNGVSPIVADAENEILKDLYSGFLVSSSADESIPYDEDTYVEIYPVTYLENYKNQDLDKYKEQVDKVIQIHFRKTLNADKVSIAASDDTEIDLINSYLQLIGNDNNLNSFALKLNYLENPMTETRFFEMYEIEAVSSLNQKISTFIDGKNNVVIMANSHTDDIVEVKIILKPVDYVGEIEKVEKSIYVKGEVRPDEIQVKKNGEIISDVASNNIRTDIFDYYEEGNSLGALFNFKPMAKSGAEIYQGLNYIQIVVSPDILCRENCFDSKEFLEDKEVSVNSKLYSLQFHLFNEYLKFYYDENSKNMVSEIINEESRVYIKYIDGEGTVESSDFGIEIKSIHKPEDLYFPIPNNWKNLQEASVELDFNRLEGVKTLVVEAGEYERKLDETDNQVKGYYTGLGVNPQYVYLDRAQGLQNEIATIKYVAVKHESVYSVDEMLIPKTTFNVKIEALSNVANPLKIYDAYSKDGLSNLWQNRDDKGVDQFVYNYDNEVFIDIVGLILTNKTDIGDYKITFYQENIAKGSIICRVYESLSGTNVDNLSFETNKKAFKNSNYQEIYPEADYIVASGQNLNIEVDLKDAVINSNIVAGYAFNYQVGYTENDEIKEVANKNLYFEKAHDDTSFNNAILRFLKGTFINEKPQYVYLTVTIYTLKFDDIITISKEFDDSNKITLKFFIYEEIEPNDISINHTSMTRYFEEYLGVYYKEQSQANLKIEMAEELWNYAAKITIGDKELPDIKWEINETIGNVTYLPSSDNKECDLQFKSVKGYSGYSVVAKAKVEQFDNIFEFRCVFNVEKPIISEKVVIKSDVKVTDDKNQNYYINLKNGESYTVIAQNYSNLGEVSNKDIIIQVADENGSAYTAKEYFEVDQDNNKITVKKVSADEGETQHKFKLIVFAKDALKYVPSADKSGYNSPSSFLLNYEQDEDDNRYIKAFFVIDIKLSDGTKDNPYLITDANEFWQIDDTEEFSNAYYELQTSISLTNTSDENEKIIRNFKGTISTPTILDEKGNVVGVQTYIIDEITLNNNTPNLFKGFAGNISNINFVVNYDYNFEQNSVIIENLGIFDVNAGTLTDVSVTAGGKGVFDRNNATFNFGALVGVNEGNIFYEDNFGVNGLINLEGKSTTYFGGLVGKNVGQIIGTEDEQSKNEDEQSKNEDEQSKNEDEQSKNTDNNNNVVLNTDSGRVNALSQIEIHSTLSGGSSVGGVIGLNTYKEETIENETILHIGIIHNAFVEATIIAETTSNVGGVIGTNQQRENAITIYNNSTNYITSIEDVMQPNLVDETVVRKFIDNAIYNIKSASKIIANNNVGGIVGTDVNGVYINCDYQILSATQETAIIANNNVGGIAGQSSYGKFAYCSVMSYLWDYSQLTTNASKVIIDRPDIEANDYLGGIVGFAENTIRNLDWATKSQLEISDRVIVAFSSVNAYLKSNKVENGNIGGILTTEKQNNSAIIFNAYFIGMLEGDVRYTTASTNSNTITHYLSLDNNGSSLYNVVYTINLVNNNGTIEIYKGNLKGGSLFNIEEDFDNTLDYWWYNENVNGGYIFVTLAKAEDENKVPIFDLAPQTIDVKIKDSFDENKVIDAYKIADRVLYLNYYDFSENTNLTDVELAELSDQYNGYNKNLDIMDLLEFDITPANIGQVVLNVKSTRTKVVDILRNGRLLINGVGESELVFSSILNPNTGAIENRTIKIVVDYPIGDEFYISTNKTDESKILTSSSTVGIPIGTTTQFYVITKGTKPFAFDGENEKTNYKYKTKDNVHLDISIKGKYKDIGEIEDTIENFNPIFSISGKKSKYENIIKENDNYIYSISLDNKTPITISTLRDVELPFEITMQAYTLVADEKYTFKEKKVTFNLTTKAGVTDASFSYDEAIVYPNDTVYLTAYISTDEQITDVSKIYKSIKFLGGVNYKFETTDYSAYLIYYKDKEAGSFKIFVDDFSKYENEVQTVRFRIEFDDDINILTETDIQLAYQVGGETLAGTNYTIIPQRINKIEIKNYYYKNVGAEQPPQLVLDNVLKPNVDGNNQSGLITLDMVPENAYYSYLEISDITGDEEILFIQVDEDDKALTLNSDISSDKKGIKLYGEIGERLYIRTQIDKNYSSKIHTIEIRAYTNLGNLLYSQTKEIDVKMLPRIKVDYVLPDGTLDRQVDSSLVADTYDLYLANGVDANFNIVTENANSELETKIEITNADLSSKYEFRNDVANHYVLDRLDVTDDENLSDYIGEKIKITFTTYYYLDNGDFEKAECSIEFTLVEFVIHSVSVNNSIDNSNTTEIYGYYDKPIKLNFYFDKYDISYYDKTAENEPFWATNYEYTPGCEKNYEDDENKALYLIYSILRELNGYDEDKNYIRQDKNEYLTINENTRDSNGYYIDIDSQIPIDDNGNKTITLSKNELNVKLDYNVKTVEENNKKVKKEALKYLAVEFKMFYGNGWTIATKNTIVDENLPNTPKPYKIDKNYNLNFIKATLWYEPTIVRNEEDFLNMSSGGRYLLANDITLKNYSPLDANLVEFDGNGRTITIQGFASFNEVEINAGLFKQVYEDMVVRNVVVKYESIEDDVGNDTFGNVVIDKNAVQIEYTDLCNNKEINYTSVNFGGITAINKGIITNCWVEGQIAIHASTLEQKQASGGGNYEIDFFIGGAVAENSSTGYITNSTTNLNIYAQANIGGFAYSNSGKIVSCSVEKETTIYGYNNTLSKTIVTRVAGFTVENSNEISMSYVNMDLELETNSVYKGKMSAKDLSAGFVYSNSGMIVDTYVNILNTGINNNTFSGFVTQNSGTIKRAYTYINRGLKIDSSDSMFAMSGSEGYENCIEFIVEKTGYTSGVQQGLVSVDISNRYRKSIYEEQLFAFGDNSSAVWKIDSGAMPTLVSANERSKYDGNSDYDGLMRLFKETKFDEATGVESYYYSPNMAYYGTKENPYIINNLEAWNTYFTDNTTAYFRIVKDIDFSNYGDNPITSKMTFKGNIQGNNMKLNNIMLYSTSNLGSLGLFKTLEGVGDKNLANSIRNLTITSTSVWASKTQAVGLLAGIAENFNLFNITIDAENVIMVGGNAVGGLVGLVRGEFDIDQISSNVGVNSTRASTQYNYSIYISHNNRQTASFNLQDVYYAGSAFGILDGYNRNSYDVSDNKDLSKTYYYVRNIIIDGNVTILGDTVGGAFGLIGERVYVKNVNVNISGSLAGVQYAAGIAGENRGVIDNNNLLTVIADDTFIEAKNVAAGLVGLNMGGLIRNAQVQVNINKSGYGKIVGGIVGRNIYGTINNVLVDGDLRAYFTGGIVGVDYTNKMLLDATSGAGTISSLCKENNRYLIPSKQNSSSKQVEYYENGSKIENYQNVSLTQNTFENLLDFSKQAYAYQDPNTTTTANFDEYIIKNKVVGLIVGLSYEGNTVINQQTITENEGTLNAISYKTLDISVDTGNKLIKFNTNNYIKQVLKGTESDNIELSKASNLYYNLAEDEIFNLLNYTQSQGTDNSTAKDLKGDFVMYVIGAEVSSFDSWSSSYYFNTMLIVRIS